VELNPFLPNLAKRAAQMYQVVLKGLAVDDDVVNIAPREAAAGAQCRIHDALEKRRGVLEPKGHNHSLIQSVRFSESCLATVFLRNLDLMVAPTQVERGKPCATLNSVKDFLRGRQLIVVRHADLV
jgi:hypothetical protein